MDAIGWAGGGDRVSRREPSEYAAAQIVEGFRSEARHNRLDAFEHDRAADPCRAIKHGLFAFKSRSVSGCELVRAHARRDVNGAFYMTSIELGMVTHVEKEDTTSYDLARERMSHDFWYRECFANRLLNIGKRYSRIGGIEI